MSTLFNEYPRPQMKRDSYLNLNGTWNCKIVNKKNDLKYSGKINVPYSPETSPSGVNVKVMPGDLLTYEKHLEVPQDFNKGRLLLNFGAVDQICYLYINGKIVYKHLGGYIPFSCDITDYVEDNNINIKLRVYDYTDKLELSRGKQSLKPGGINYDCQSGIWQTVWMESVPEEYIRYVKITPDVDNQAFVIKVLGSNYMPCEVEFMGKKYNISTDESVRIPIENPIYWEIDNPYLYDVKVRCGKDEVSSYFGYRKVELKEVDGVKKLFLNGKETYIKGILEQGYYKEGLYTPDSYQTFEEDIRLIKECGFNTIRKHIKIEPDMYYYLCDKYGMLVIQDMVNGGAFYNLIVIGLPLLFDVNMSDKNYKLFSRNREHAKKVFEYEIKNSVKALYNHPSIIMWTLFNEGWGQFDSERLYKLLTKLDKTRLIDAASGWYDQGLGDLRSDHSYYKPYKAKEDPKGRAIFLSEFGGVSLNSKSPLYKNVISEYEYINAIKKTIDRDVESNKNIMGYVYTQYNDIMQEENGIVDVDRNLKTKQLKNVFKN